MSGLLDELLTLARGDVRRREQTVSRVLLAELVRSVCIELAPLFETKQVELATTLPDGLPYVPGDTSSLRRLLTSLLENGLKYTSPGGKVVVSVRGEAGGQVLEVRDSGCGIPDDSLPHIFDRFYRVDSARDRRSGGYGLGLAIAQQIARFHGTEIEVGSTVGQGSCFRVRLPDAAPTTLSRAA